MKTALHDLCVSHECGLGCDASFVYEDGPRKFVVVAVFLNILSALIISCIINPYDVSKEDEQLVLHSEPKKNHFSKS